MKLQHEERLSGVNASLANVVRRATQYVDFDLLVVEGLRTEARQRELVAKGASRTMKSRHLVGEAVDLAPIVSGQLRWDWPLFPKINAAMQRAAQELGVRLVWGGDWRSFRDGPHWELAK